jgi:iron complex outermembrane receptor protein
MKRLPFTKTSLSTALGLSALAAVSSTALQAQDRVIEEVVVVAEKRSENLQDLSQAVTSIGESELEVKNISSFVDLSAIAPGVTVAKNEGYKTVISIRGVGNEANQNAIANPSVSFHMDGIYIASPFALQTDFIDVERIEVLRGPQGTLFGQNSTAGAINVISKRPNSEELEGKADLTVGDYNLTKLRGSINIPISDSIATRTSFSSSERDGFTKNIHNGQELDDVSSISFRSDWSFDVSDTTNFRVFAQYFDADSNGAAIKGIDDRTRDDRKLSQDTKAQYELESKIVGAIAEFDLDFASIKTLASWQEDDILVVRDNDRHNFGDTLPNGSPYIRSEFNPETSVVETKTFEVNIISNEPLMGSLDWIVGAFYLETDIENSIREFLDKNNNGTLEPYVPVNPPFDIFGAEVGFISDAFPSRKSFSLYGQTTLSISEDLRLITGLRYTEDKVTSDVSNFLGAETFTIDEKTDKVTGRVVVEYDFDQDTMAYVSYTRGFKPGGSNLTFGFENDNAPALVLPVYEDESIDAYEFGLKKDLLDGRLRTNIAAFYYEYENLQFQATDPDIFRGGVANIPESEIAGVELELLALISDAWTLDVKMAVLDSEVTSDYQALDNVKAQPFFFGQEDVRFGLRENINGNDLAKSPDLTADISLQYETITSGGHRLTGTMQYIYRGEFEQRVFANPDVDNVEDYDIINLVAGIELNDGTWGFDVMVLNVADEDGVNSRMTDVFGISATGEERVAPRQVMGRVRYNF